MNRDIIKVQGSKSIINRILIISTFLDEELVLENYAQCSDVVTLEQSLKHLGWSFIHQADKVKIIKPQQVRDANLYIKDAGTAFRFLAVKLATLAGRKYSLDLSPQLKLRPHKILAELLREMGAPSF